MDPPPAPGRCSPSGWLVAAPDVTPVLMSQQAWFPRQRPGPFTSGHSGRGGGGSCRSSQLGQCAPGHPMRTGQGRGSRWVRPQLCHGGGEGAGSVPGRWARLMRGPWGAGHPGLHPHVQRLVRKPLLPGELHTRFNLEGCSMEAGVRGRVWMGSLGGRPSCSRTAVGSGDPSLCWLPTWVCEV